MKKQDFRNKLNRELDYLLAFIQFSDYTTFVGPPTEWMEGVEYTVVALQSGRLYYGEGETPVLDIVVMVWNDKGLAPYNEDLNRNDD